MAFRPIVLKDSELTIDSEDFAAQVSGVTFTPTTASVSWQGLKPASSFTDQSAATWAAELAYAQDWHDADALSRFLHEHEGQSLEAVFTPKTGEETVTATIIIAPGTIGGQVNTFMTSTVTLGVSGKPAIGTIVVTP